MIQALALLFPAFLSLSTVPEKTVANEYTRIDAADTVIVTSAAVKDSLLAKPADTTRTLAVVDTSALKGAGFTATDLIAFAQTLKGTRYKYASADPKRGFDCSGFVSYVFHHFQMSVPRSSVAYTKIGMPVELDAAKPGDVILFTGTNSSRRVVGHVGIITQASDTITFIHASSGKSYSVTETTLNPHYKKRFMKVVRLLK